MGDLACLATLADAISNPLSNIALQALHLLFDSPEAICRGGQTPIRDQRVQPIFSPFSVFYFLITHGFHISAAASPKSPVFSVSSQLRLLFRR